MCPTLNCEHLINFPFQPKHLLTTPLSCSCKVLRFNYSSEECHSKQTPHFLNSLFVPWRYQIGGSVRSFKSDLLCLSSCTAIDGLLLHSMASMRTTITNVLVLITGGVIISWWKHMNIIREKWTSYCTKILPLTTRKTLLACWKADMSMLIVQQTQTTESKKCKMSNFIFNFW